MAKNSKNTSKNVNFQTIITRLNEFWAKQGVLIGQPYGLEVGAGTANPNTFFKVLGPEPFSVAYVEPSRRPADGRYGENPNRLQHYFQYQIILKPAPYNHIQLYLDMLSYLGIDLMEHDVRFVEDNWASPSLRAWGVGWEVWLDSMEVSQYTYFQQMGGIDLEMPTVEITLGLERLAMYINNIDDYKDIPWNNNIKYGDIFKQHEFYQSKYNFEDADIDVLKQLLALYEKEVSQLIKKGNFWPAYDYVLRMSHIFNILDARGAASDTYRRELFKKMGKYLSLIAKMYVESRKQLGFPLISKEYDNSSKKDVVNDSETRESKDFGSIGFYEHSVIGKLNVANNLQKYAIETFDTILGKDFDINKALIIQFEIEDLPEPALSIIKDRCTNKHLQSLFKEVGLSYSGFYPIVTPSRVGFILKNVGLLKEGNMIVGPPEHIAFKEGQPTDILNKLLAKYKKILIKYKIKDGRVVFYVKNQLDRKYLLNSVYKAIFADIPYMHMKINNKNVIRPLLSYIYAENGQMYEVDGFNMLPEGLQPNILVLPKWMSGKYIKIESPSSWLEIVGKLGMILHPDYRFKFIKQFIDNYLAENSNNKEIFNYLNKSKIEKVFETVTMLTTTPTVYFEQIPEKYNVLPESVIDYVLWSNQKYIVLKQVDEQGEVIRYLAGIVSDNPLVQAKKNIKKGALKVITARLDDALFYFNRDKDVSFEDLRQATKNKQLGPILGTLVEKQHRMTMLVNALCENSYASDIPENSKDYHLPEVGVLTDILKLDLVTNLGKEFPALEGKIMAAYLSNPEFLLYHKNSVNENKKIIEALQNYGDIQKSNLYGLIALLFDKMDDIFKLSIAKGFPKGSADPYGIKARADIILQVLIKLLNDFKITFNFVSFVKDIVPSYYSDRDFDGVNGEYINEFFKFFNQRLLSISTSNLGVYKLEDYNLNILRSVLLSKYGFIVEKLLESKSLLNLLSKEQFRDSIKRIYNLIRSKYDFNKQPLHFVNKDLDVLYPSLQRLSMKTEVIGNRADSILDLARELVDKLQKRSNYYVIINQSGFFEEVSSSLQDIITQTSAFIDNNRINDPSNPDLTTLRLAFLHIIAQIIQIFVNIPVLLNQA